ncbi:MAG: trigger factor [Bacteroidales bacterium]|nr:trigger factor [Bacteroidales bacterium]
MDISRENTGHLEATLKLKVTEDDYRERIEKELKNLQKKAQMPGFRPGKVPMGLVKKMYGKSVLVEEVNKLLAEAVMDYIKKENLNVLGSPIPNKDSAEKIDWDTQTTFELDYLIGLSPEIDLELSPDIEVEYHRIKVSDESVENFIQDVRKRNGTMVHPGTVGEEDIVFGEFVELGDNNQPKEGGHSNKTNVYVRFVKDDEIRKQMIGLKPGSELVMDMHQAMQSEGEVAHMLSVKKEELENYGRVFRFTVESINRLEPAELNEELYEKLIPGKEVKTEEAFRAEVAKLIGEQHQLDVDRHFKNLVQEKLIEQAGLSLPESFLKKWILENNEANYNAQQVEDEFEKAADSFRWQLIENHLLKQYNVEVKPEEVQNQLAFYIKSQLAQYGQQDVPKEIIDKYVDELSKKEEEVKKVYDQLYDVKLTALFKEKLKLKETEISYDDFVKLITAKYKNDNEPPASAEEAKTE